jgi:predicted amidohydrolase YtcJ
MTRPRASMVVIGQVLVAARRGGLETAEALGIADGRVVSVGPRTDVVEGAAADARVLDAGPAAVLPGLHDFHLHLVGMARARREVTLDAAADFEAVVATVKAAAARLAADGWLRGRGWHEAAVAGDLQRLEEAVGGRPALLYSHDGHSAWASAAALRRAGLQTLSGDPPGGRLERNAVGAPSGLLRERATDLVDAVAGRLVGSELDDALDEALHELAAMGITGAVDAGDSSADNGVGEYAFLGDRASLLMAARQRLDGRIRLTINLPAEAIAAAAEAGLRTGAPLPDTATQRVGWAKAFVDGALGSRTAALFAPYSCGPGGDTGIPRLTPEELDALFAAGRSAGIGLAVHAIGDRGAATVLDAIERAPQRTLGVPPDRIEHLQLLRPADRPRLAANDVTASVQPVHCAADRPLVEACWAARTALAYPWRSLVEAGARLAFGSDAPIESANLWLGIFAALHRRRPADGTPDWHPEQALEIGAAIAGYTLGPATAADRADEGHLRPGARADLAILDVDLATLLRGDEALAAVRSDVTMVGGVEVHRS